MKARIYIAGPYTKGDVARNVANAMEAGNLLIIAGYAPFIPHLTHFVHMSHYHPYATWLEQDLQWLPLCHALLRLPGVSSGADQEVKEAQRLHIPVFHDLEPLYHAITTEI